MRRMKVLKRFGRWHYWCPCCMGGDWGYTWANAYALADAHAHGMAHER